MATRVDELPMLLGLAPWEIWVLGMLALVIGSLLFAFATLQAEVLSCRAGIALAAASGAFLLAAILGFGFSGAALVEQATLVVTVVAFGASWVWLGLSALWRGPIRTVAAA